MTAELDGFALGTGLIGGLAIFLFGMDVMTGALKQVAGDHMKSMLARMTGNRFVGLATGATITAIIQSSSITTVLLVGFISAGLMSMPKSIAVILGADIGTTITAQVLAFKVTKIALPMIATGFFVSLLSKHEGWRQAGLIFLGLGLVFFGMSIMSDAMRPLRSYEPFLDYMLRLENPVMAALIGAAFTALIQSSSATTGILIVMASQGLVGLEAAIALALGANIGTCITAALASIGKPREAVRAAVAHTLIKIIGVSIWIGFVPQLAELARYVSPAYPHLAGLARDSAEVPRQIANAHTLFNVVNATLFIGFTSQLARFIEWLVPDRPQAKSDRIEARFLDDKLIETPSIALDATRREIIRMAEEVRNMLQKSVPVTTTGSPLALTQLAAMDRPVNALHRQIIGYMREISLRNLTKSQSNLLIAFINIANDLEAIGDRISTNMVTSAKQRIDENVVVTKKTARKIANLHKSVLAAFDEMIVALETENRKTAKEVQAMKKSVAKIMKKTARHEIARLQADEPNRLRTYAREVELVEILEEIFKTTRRIARTQMAIFEPANTNVEPAEEKIAV